MNTGFGVRQTGIPVIVFQFIGCLVFLKKESWTTCATFSFWMCFFLGATFDPCLWILVSTSLISHPLFQSLAYLLSCLFLSCPLICLNLRGPTALISKTFLPAGFMLGSASRTPDKKLEGQKKEEVRCSFPHSSASLWHFRQALKDSRTFCKAPLVGPMSWVLVILTPRYFLYISIPRYHYGGVVNLGVVTYFFVDFHVALDLYN